MSGDTPVFSGGLGTRDVPSEAPRAGEGAVRPDGPALDGARVAAPSGVRVEGGRGTVVTCASNRGLVEGDIAIPLRPDTGGGGVHSVTGGIRDVPPEVPLSALEASAPPGGEGRGEESSSDGRFNFEDATAFVREFGPMAEALNELAASRAGAVREGGLYGVESGTYNPQLPQRPPEK